MSTFVSRHFTSIKCHLKSKTALKMLRFILMTLIVLDHIFKFLPFIETGTYLEAQIIMQHMLETKTCFQ